MEAAKRGDVWGVVHLGQNFTDEIMVRQADGSAASNETIEASQIGVRLDYSSEWRDSAIFSIFVMGLKLSNRPCRSADFTDYPSSAHGRF